MKRTPMDTELSHFPAPLHGLLEGAKLFDSSCSPDARVWFIDREEGFYLKRAARGSLRAEAEMTRYFHEKGLAAQVLDYLQTDADWLLTRRVPGEDCTHSEHLSEPKRLAELLGTLLRQLHGQDTAGCPVPDRTKDYLQTVSENYHKGHYDRSLFPDNWGYASAEEAWQAARDAAPLLRSDTLIHGDYCLPNILLHNGQFSGFIDLGNGGVGDRHIDLFWGVWSLGFNLKTDAWTDRFLDAYGRDGFDPEILERIGAFEVFG